LKIENLKELKALLRLCQTEGVHSIEIDGIKMLLGEPKVGAPVVQDSKPEPALYTDEDLLMWSAGGHSAPEGN